MVSSRKILELHRTLPQFFIISLNVSRFLQDFKSNGDELIGLIGLGDGPIFCK